jgi:hypothetical protein
MNGSGCTNTLPRGYLDGVSSASNAVWGWAYDPDTSSGALDVHFYLDGPAGSGQFAGAVTTTVARADVNSAFGITGIHGFDWAIPVQYRTGSHTVYAYAIDSAGGTNPQIDASPQTFTY